MLHLPSAWTWDFWLADDGQDYHLFFLKASRALLDPDLRHWRATIGHAVSRDLRNWSEVADALVPSDGPGWDDLATWTGSVVRGPDDHWHMFYTGVARAERGLRQRIGVAVSDDLTIWHRDSAEPVVEADPRWYETLADGSWPDEAWRDPWIVQDPAGAGWHMLITARSRHGDPDQRGVVGHAFSEDLRSWSVRPPLSGPGQGFGQLEVPQTVAAGNMHLLVFSCLGSELSLSARAAGTRGGVWVSTGAGPLGPWDIAGARRLTGESLYAGRLVQDREGRWFLLAFRHRDDGGGFIGELADPLPVTIGTEGALVGGSVDHETALPAALAPRTDAAPVAAYDQRIL